MPLVKGNTVVADEFVHLADDAPIPAEGTAVLLPAWDEGSISTSFNSTLI